MSFIRIGAAALVAATLAGPLHAAPGFDGTMEAPPAPADAEAGPRPGPDFGPRRHMGGGAPGLPFLRGIALSEAQQDRLFAIMHAQAPQLREQDKAERKAHEALRAMREAGQYDEARAAAQSTALGQAIAARELLRVRTAAQVMALLTPQQKEALARGALREQGPDAARR
ncbi:MAG: Spy/CpxP family protein refolding chaperone [Pseudomonadota bacterium]